VMASKDNNSKHLVCELADLWFHSLVLMGYHNITMDDIASELERREGVSGLEEKASR
jgi:phosphoribosyl-ATP pyrophosphohydrolase